MKSTDIRNVDKEFQDYLALQRKNSVMLVEDNDLLRGLERETLDEDGFAVYSAGDYEHFELYLRNGLRADLYVLDCQLPWKKGDNPQEIAEKMIEIIRQDHSNGRIVIKSAQGCENLAERLKVDVAPKGIKSVSEIVRSYF